MPIGFFFFFKKLISFTGNKKSSLKQNVRRDHATMQQNVLLHFWVIFTMKWGQNMKKLFCCPSLELFSCLPPLLSCLPLWKTVELPVKSYKMKKIQYSIAFYIVPDFWFLKSTNHRKASKVLLKNSDTCEMYVN